LDTLLVGDVDRDEWNETVDFFLELKEEEEEMHKHEKTIDRAQMQRKLREQKLQELQQVSTKPGSKPKQVDVEAGRAPAHVERRVTAFTNDDDESEA
jgi:hypothetical protein